MNTQKEVAVYKLRWAEGPQKKSVLLIPECLDGTSKAMRDTSLMAFIVSALESKCQIHVLIEKCFCLRKEIIVSLSG